MVKNGSLKAKTRNTNQIIHKEQLTGKNKSKIMTVSNSKYLMSNRFHFKSQAFKARIRS